MIGKIISLLLAWALVLSAAFAENALENVERRTAEILKIDRSKVGEWIPKRNCIAVVGIAALENKSAAEIIGRRHELAEVAIMDAKLKLAEKLGFALSAEEKRHLWGDSEADKEVAGITTSSKIAFLSKHQILGATVLLQSESNLEGEYLMAVSLVWSMGLQKSAQTLLSGSGNAVKLPAGKHSLEDWIEKSLDLALVVGPRQYVDNEGKRHFIGIVSLPCSASSPASQRLAVRRMLQVKGAATVAWSLRSDVETSAVSETVLEQKSVDGGEKVDVASELTQRIHQRFRGAVPPVRPLLKDVCVYREHPLFPGSQMAVYACELDGEFSEYVHVDRH